MEKPKKTFKKDKVGKLICDFKTSLKNYTNQGDSIGRKINK